MDPHGIEEGAWRDGVAVINQLQSAQKESSCAGIPFLSWELEPGAPVRSPAIHREEDDAGGEKEGKTGGASKAKKAER